MSGPRVAWAVLRKDILLDLRTRDRLGHMLVFAALIIVLLSLVLPSPDAATRAWIPALLWVVFLFTALLGLGRSFSAESEGGAGIMLRQAPCDRGWVFLGKAAANGIALVGVQLWTALWSLVFLEVDWSRAVPQVLAVGVLGAIGLSAVGTLLSALANGARFREFLLPVMLFPFILPVLVIASRMTAASLNGEAIEGTMWGTLALYDWVFVLLAYFVFDFVLEE